jgi:hypothetical protein
MYHLSIIQRIAFCSSCNNWFYSYAKWRFTETAKEGWNRFDNDQKVRPLGKLVNGTEIYQVIQLPGQREVL